MVEEPAPGHIEAPAKAENTFPDQYGGEKIVITWTVA